jgi:DNA-binding winged helix-turn-helix (wHTH) protein
MATTIEGVRYKFGPYSLDTRTGELRRDNARIQLRPKVFELLVVLVKNGGRLVPKSELLDELWSDVHVEQGSLTRAIAYLRSALDDSPEQPRYVATIARRGYRFIAEVQRELRHPSPFCLVAESDRYPLMEGENVVGRADDCKVSVKLASVSRYHAVITIHGREATLRDLGSKNGTFLRGRRVDGAVNLIDGNQLRLGSVPMTFSSDWGDPSTVTDFRVAKESAARG